MEDKGNEKQPRKIKLFTNWQIIIIATGLFVFLLFFTDNSNIIYKEELKVRLENTIIERDSLLDQIRKDSVIISKIKTDDKFLEKYARETFYYRAPDEDVFMISPK